MRMVLCIERLGLVFSACLSHNASDLNNIHSQLHTDTKEEDKGFPPESSLGGQFAVPRMRQDQLRPA